MEFSKPGGGGRGSRPIPNFFCGFFGVFSKSFGKTLEMVWFIQKCKEKNFTFVGGWYPVLYGTVLYKIVQYTVKIWSANFFSSISGWIRTYSFVSMCFWATWKKPKILETFQTLGGGPESLENSKLFLGFFFEGFPYHYQSTFNYTMRTKLAWSGQD